MFAEKFRPVCSGSAANIHKNVISTSGPSSDMQMNVDKMGEFGRVITKAVPALLSPRLPCERALPPMIQTEIVEAAPTDASMAFVPRLLLQDDSKADISHKAE